MLIQWYGQTCFKIQAKTLKAEPIIVIDPFDKSTGLRQPNLSADIVLVTNNRPEFSNIEIVKSNSPETKPFIIKGPGEYEAKDVFISGFNVAGEKNPQTIYVIQVEDMTLVHLAGLSSPTLTSEQLETVEETDILIIPVGGSGTLNAQQAAELIGQIEPRIIIPMYYKIPGLKQNLDSLEKFTKEIGLKPEEALEKFKITKKDLPQEETRLIVLQP